MKSKFYKQLVGYLLIACNLLLLATAGFSQTAVTGWSFQVPVSIDNIGKPARSNWQVPVIVNTQTLILAGKMQALGQDIRFVDENCTNVFLDYYIDDVPGYYQINTSQTMIWVKIPNIPANTSKVIYMLYGNPSASAAQNFSAVFPNSFDLTSGTTTLTGAQNFDYFRVQAGATVFITDGSVLQVNARAIRIHGTINGDTRGYNGSKVTAITNGSGPNSTQGGGIAPSTAAAGKAGGGGAYGNLGGCQANNSPLIVSCGGAAAPYGTTNGTDIDMGGGGATGAGAVNAASVNTNTTNQGGDGGGALSAIGSSVIVTTTVTMNGEDGGAEDANTDGGGGGAGGGILLRGREVKLNGASLMAKGGNPRSTRGGGGSGGRIKIFYDAAAAPTGYTTSVAGGTTFSLPTAGTLPASPAFRGADGTSFVGFLTSQEPGFGLGAESTNIVPATPVANNVQRCGSGTVTFSVSASSGVIARLYTIPTGGTPIATSNSGPLYQVTSNVITATTTFYISAASTATGCESNRVSVIATVLTPPGAPLTGAVSRCGTGILTITASMGAPAGDIIRMWDAATGGNLVAIDNSSPYDIVTPTLTTTTTFYIESYNSVTMCASGRSAAVATINPIPSDPNGPSTVQRCGPGNVTFNAALPQGDMALLYDSPLPTANLLGTSMSPFTFSVGVNTTTQFYVSSKFSTTNCESTNRFTIQVNVNTVPTAPSVENIQKCGTATATATFTALMGAIPGNEMRLYTIPSGGNPIVTDNSSPYNLATNVVATTTYYVSANNTSTGCEGPRTQVIVTLLPDLGVPLAINSSVTRCGAGPVTFTAIMGIPAGTAIRLWDAPAGGNMLISDGTLPYELTTPTLAVSATVYTYYLENYNAVTNCSSTRVPVTVTVNSAPAAPAVAAVNPICGSGTVNVNGTLPAATQQARLYDAAVAGNLIASSSSSAYNFNLFINASVTYYLSAFDVSTGCEGTRTAVALNVAQVPGAPNAPNITRCGSGQVTFTALMGSPLASGISIYDTPTGGVPLAQNLGPTFTLSPASAAYNPLGATTTFYIEAFNNFAPFCVSSRTPVVASINEVPSPPTATSPVTICPGSVTLNASMSTPPGTEIRLFQAATGGTQVTADNSFPYQLTTPFNGFSTTYFLEVVNTVSGCSSASRTPVVVDVVATPLEPTSTDVYQCGNGANTFTVTSTAAEVRLYDQPTNGSLLAIDNAAPFTLTTPTVTATTTFYIESATAGTPSCPSPTRTPVILNVMPNPGPASAGNVIRCGTGAITFTVNMGSPSGTEVSLWDSPTGGTQVNTDNTFIYNLTTNIPIGISNYYIEIVNNQPAPLPSCTSTVRTLVTATAYDNPGAPAVTNVTRCGIGAVVFTVNMVTPPFGNEVQILDLLDNLIAIDNAPAYELSVNVNANQTFKFKVVNTTTGCQSTTVNGTATVSNSPNPDPPSAAPVSRCSPGVLTFSANMGSVAGDVINFYSTSTGGVPIASSGGPFPAPFTTPFIATTSTFYIESARTGALASCLSSRVPIVATIHPNPGTPTSLDQVRCGPGILSFTASMGSPLGDVMRFYDVPVGGTAIASDNIAPYEFTTPSIAATTTYYTESVNIVLNCSSARIPIVATINQLPGAPTTSNVSRCGSGAVTINAALTPPPGTQIRMYDVLTGGSVIASDNTPPFELNVPLLPATTTYYLETLNETSNCVSSSRTPVIASILQVPSAPPTVSNVFRCLPGTATFTVSMGLVTGDVMRLYQTATGGTALSTDNVPPFTLSTPFITSTTTFYPAVASSVTGCESSRVPAVAFVDPPPSAPSAFDVVRCGTGTVTFSGALGPIAGDQIRLYDVPFGGSPVATDVIANPYTITTPSISTTTVFYITVANLVLGCEGNRTAVTATVNPQPAQPVSIDESRCGPGSVSFFVGMGSPLGTEIRLYDQPVGGTLLASDNTSPYQVITPPIVTSTLFYVESTDAVTGCASSRLAVTANILEALGLPNVSDVIRCGTGPVTFSTTMGFPAGNAMRLYYDQVGGSPILTDLTPPFNMLSPSLSTTTTFYVASINTVNGCESVRTPVTAVINETPGAPSAANVAICGGGNATITALAGTPGGNQMNLYTSSIGGALLYSDNLPPYELVVNVTASSTFYVESFNNVTNCASTRIPVLITVNQLPGAPIGNNTSICGSGVATFTASMSAPSGNEMLLYDVAVGGNILSADQTAPYTVRTPIVGTTQVFYIASRNTTTGCESQRTPATVTVSQLPGNPVVSNVTRCGSGRVTFTGIMGVPAGDQMRLYDADAGGSTIAIDNLAPFELSSPILTASTTYYMSSQNLTSGCESGRVPVVATVNGIPGAPIANNTPRCGPGAVVVSPSMGSPAGSEMRLYDAAVGGQLVNSDNTLPYTLTSTPATNNTIFYVASADAGTGCESVRTPFQAIINQVPDAPIVTGSQRCGAGVVTFSPSMGTISGTETRLYTAVAGGTPISSDASAPFELRTPEIMTTTNYYIAVYDATTQCESGRTTITGLINPVPALPTVANVARCSPGAVTFTVASNIPAGDEVLLYSTSSGGFAIDNDNAPPFNVSTPALAVTTTFYISIRITATGCESGRIMAIGEITTIPGPPIVTDAQRCGPGVVTFTVTPGSPTGNIMRLYDDPIAGNPIATDATVPYELTTPLPINNNGVFYVESYNTITACPSVRVPVNAIINTVPAAPGAASVSRCGTGTSTFTGIMNSPAGNQMVLYSGPIGGVPLATKNSAPFELPTPTVASTTSFYLAATITNTGCESARTPVDVIVNPAPGVPSVSGVARCGTGAVTLSATMGIPVGDQINLYTVSSGSLPIASDNNPPYEMTTPPLGATTTFFVASFNSVTGCEGARRAVIVTVNDIPGLPSVLDVSRCGPGPVSFTVSMGLPNGTEIRLYDQAIGGNIVASDNISPYIVTSSSINVTSNFYIVSSNTTTGCESSRVPVNAIINSLPAQPTATDVNRCGSGAVTFTGAMGSPSGTEMRLYDSPTASTPLITDNTPLYEMLTPIISATTTFYISSFTVGTNCESARTPVSATIFPAPGSPTSQDVSRCGTGTITFTGTPTFPIGNRLRLFSEGGTLLAFDDAAPYELTTPPLVGTTTFQLEAVNTATGCASLRKQVVALINQIPGTPEAGNVTRCGAGQVSISATMTAPTGSGIRIFDAAIGGTELAVDASSPFILTTPSIATNTTIFAETYNQLTGCVSARTPVTITINQVPAAPIVQDEPRCGTGTVTFTAQMGSPAGDELRLYATSVSTTPLAVDALPPFELGTPTPLNTTTAFYIAVATSGTGCESPRAQVNAIINPVPGIPSPPNTTSSRCGSGIISFLAFMGSPAGNQMRLYDSQSGSVFVASDNTSPYELATPAIVTTTTYYVASVFTSTGCESARIPVTAQVNFIPGPPVAPTVQRCGPGVVTFSASMSSPFGNQMLLWDAPAGGSLVSTDGSFPYELSTSTIGITTNFFLESVDNSTNCSSIRVPVTAVVNSVPGQPVAADESRCGAGSVTFVVSPGSPAGNQMKLYGDASSETPLSVDGSIPFELTTGSITVTTSFYIESVSTSTGCASPRSIVTATVNPTIGPPIVAEVSRCETGVVTFTALMGTPIGNEMQIFDVAIGGTPLNTDITSPYTLATPSITTTSTFFVQSVNTFTGCISGRTPALAVVNTRPGPPLVSDVSRCGKGQVTFTAIMDVPVGSQMRLYSTQFGGTPLAVDNTSPYTLASPTISVTGNFFVASINTVTGCESERTQTSAIINTLPASPIAADAVRCGSGSVTYTASMGTPAGNKMNLYDSPTGGTLLADDASAPYELTSPILTSVVVHFIESQNTVTGCTSVRTPVVARVSQSPGAPAVADASRCGPGVVQVIANMSIPSGDQMRLYDQSSGGAPLGVVNSSPYITNTPFINTTTTYYVASVNQSTGCESNRTPVTATINPLPGTPISNDVSRCGAGLVTFTATMTLPVGNVMVLYDSEFGGTPLAQDNASPFVMTTPEINTTTVFYIASVNTVSNCESPRVAVTATINRLPESPNADNAARCGSGTVTFYPPSNISGLTLRLWDSPVGGQSIATDQTPPYELTSSSVNTNTIFYLEAQNTLTGCISARASVLALVNTNPGTPSASNQARCGIGSVTFTAFTGSPAGDGMRVYNIPVGGLPIANFASSPFEYTTAPLAATTTLYLESINSQTGCVSVRTPIVATINPIPGSPNSSSVARCGDGAVSFTAFMVAPVGNQMRLYDSESGGTPLDADNISPFILTTSSINATAIFYIASINTATGCESSRTPVTATINPIPGKIFAPNVSRCGPGAVTVSATMGVPSGNEIRLYDSVVEGVVLASDNSLPYEVTTPIISTNSTVYVASYNSLTGCESERSQVLIAINTLPGAPFASDVPRCGPGVVTFTATMGTPAGNQIRLFTTVTGGAPLSVDNLTPYELTSAVTNTNSTYYIESYSTLTNCGSLRTAVTAIINPLPNVSSVSSDSPKCVGDILNLTATGSPAGATFVWTGPNGYSATGPNPSRTITSTLEGGTYSVTANVGNCFSTIAITQVVINRIPPRPIASFYNQFGETKPLCVGDELNLAISNFDEFPVGTNFVWTGPNAYSVTTNSFPVRPAVSSQDDGNYFVRAVLNGCNSESSDALPVPVYKLPPTPVATNNGPVCSEGTGSIQLFSSNVTDAAGYTWTGPNGFSTTGRTQSRSIAPENAGVYSVVAVNSAGCTSAVAATTVTINPTPGRANVVTNAPICEGQNLTMTVSSVAGATFLITGPNGFNTSGAGPTFTRNSTVLADAGTYNVFSIVRGCTSKSATISIVVNPRPSLPTANTNSPVCVGSVMRMTASGVAGATYTFTGPGGFSVSGSGPEFIKSNATLADAGVYSLIAVAAGCTSEVVNTNFIVNPNPAVPVASTDQPKCEGQSLTLSATGEPNTVYLWTGPNSFSISGLGPNFSRDNLSALDGGVYSVRSVLNGCTSSTAIARVLVNPLPAQPSAFNDGPRCVGSDLGLAAISSTSSEYYWSGPNAYTATGSRVARTLTATSDAGVYSVVAVAGNCTSNIATTNVEVFPTPVVPNIVSNSPICEGKDLILTVDAQPGANYIWDGPNGYNVIGSGPTFTRTKLSQIDAGYYSVTSTIGNCTSDVAVATVVVNAIPNPPLATSNSPICVTQYLNLNSLGPVGSAYSWSGPNGFSSSLAAPSKQIMSTMEGGNYSVSAILNGCASAPVSIPVVVTPIPSTPFAVNNGPKCVGETLVMTATGANNASYVWNGPNGYTATGSSPTRLIGSILDAGTYTVVAISNGCTSALATTTVIVNAINNGPSASYNGPLCTGSLLNLTSSQISGATYSWVGPNGFTSNQQQPSISGVTTAHAGRYVVTAILNGCTAAVPGIVDVAIRVTPQTPSISSNSPLCSGQTLNLSASSIPGASYRWNGSGGFTSQLQNPTRTNATSAMGGIYTAIAIIDGCTSSVASTITNINAAPQAPSLANNGPLCSGETLLLTGTVSSGATIAWTGPNGYYSTEQNPVRINVSPTESGIYNAVTIIGSCSSSTVVTNVTINKAPETPEVSNNGPICAGKTLQLNASTVAGASYSWNGPNSFTSSLQSPLIQNVTSAESGVYSLVTSIGNCSSQVASTTVEVSPAATALTAGSNSPICAGQTLNLTAAQVPGATYTWTGPGGFFRTAQSPTLLNAQVNNSGNYSVVATIGNCVSEVVVSVVTVNKGVTTVITATNTGPYCAGQNNVQLSSTRVDGATYSWSGPDGFSASTINPTIPNATVAKTGTYQVVASFGNCSSNVATTNVVVNPAPPVDFASGADVKVLCSGQTLSLTSSAVAGASYTWSGPNGFISDLQNPVLTNLTVNNAGTYSVVARIGNCRTNVSTVGITISQTPSLTAAGNNGPLCTGSLLQLTSPTLPNVRYAWTGPNGFSSTLQNPTRANLITLDAGTYSVVAIANGCTSAFATTNVVVNAVTTPLTITNNGPLCPGQMLTLSATFLDGSTYRWAGPNGFSATTQNTIRMNVSVADAGLYTVTSTFAGCTTVSGQTNVIVSQAPSTPVVLANTPLCEGDMLSLTTAAVQGAMYKWIGPNGFTSTMQLPTRSNMSVADGGLYYVNVSVGNCTSDAGSVNVVVYPKPGNLVASNNGPVCAGGILQMTASYIPGVSYSWNGPGGFNSVEQNPSLPSVTTLMSGSYTVRAKLGLCATDVITTIVQVNPAPQKPVASYNGPICTGKQLSLTASTIPNATYSWRGPGGFNAVSQNPTIEDVTTNNQGLYSLTAQIGNCTSAVATVYVSINNAPVSISASSNSPVCAGTTLTLTATAVEGAIYMWSGPDGFTATGQNPIVKNVTTSTQGIYSVTVIVGQCTVPSATTIVEVSESAINFNAGANSPICVGQSLQLTAATVSGASYRWFGPGGFTSNSQNPVLTNVRSLNAGSYSVTATVGSCVSAVIPVDVVINTTPPNPVPGYNGPLCSGAQLQLTAQRVPNARYSWSGPNGFSSELPNPMLDGVTSLQAGLYSLTVKTGDCSATGTIQVDINSIPVMPLAFNNGPLCSGLSLNLSASGINGAMYMWSGPNNFSSTLQNPSVVGITPAGAGDYTLQVVVSGCSSRTAVTNVVVANPSVSFETDRITVCKGVTPEITLLAEGSGPWTVNYLRNNKMMSVVLPTPRYTFPVADSSAVFTLVSVVDDNSCTKVLGGSLILNVSEKPNAVISSSVAAPQICAGTRADFKITVDNVSSSTNWQLKYREGTVEKIINGIGPRELMLTSGLLSQTSDIQLISIANMDANPPCYRELSGVTSSIQVQVNPLPTAKLNTQNTTICAGATTSLEVTVTGKGPWTLQLTENGEQRPRAWGNSASASPDVRIIPLQPSVTTTYAIVGLIDGNECAIVIDTLRTVVTVNPLPTAGFDAQGATICSGNTVNIPIRLTGVGPWIIEHTQNGVAQPSLVIGNSTSPSPYVYNLAVSPNGTIVYEFTGVKDGTNCVGTARGTYTVTVNSTPTAAFRTANVVLCDGGKSDLQVVVTGKGPWTVYYTENEIPAQATFGDASSPSPSVFGLPVFPTQNSNYAINGVVSGSGCSNLNINNRIDVIVNPRPSVVLTSSTSSVCLGGSTELVYTVTGKGPWTMVYTINGVDQIPVTFGNANSTVPYRHTMVVAPRVPSSYAVKTVTDANGCTVVASGSNNIVNLEVVTQPTAPVATNNGPRCLGDRVQLNASTVATATAYLWKGPNGYTSTEQNPTITLFPSSAGLYEVVSVSQGCTSASGSTVVSLNTIPNAPTASLGSSPVCAGSTLRLIASSGFTGGYFWSGPNGFTSTLQNPTIPSVSTAYSGVYSVLAVSNGCTSLASTLTVTVQTPPTASITGSPTPICTGQFTTFNVNLSGTGPWTFTYSENGGPSSAPITATSSPYVLSATPTGVGLRNYALTSVSHAGGCNPGIVSGSATVQVNPAPVLTLSSKSDVSCGGSTGSFAVAVTQGTGSGYQYSLSGGETNSTGVFSNLAAGNYTVTVRDGNCTASLSVQIANSAAPTAVSISADAASPQTTALVTWNATNGAASYTLRYRARGTSTYTTISNIADSRATVTGLNANTTYEFEVQAVCSNGNTTAFSPIKEHTTAAAGSGSCNAPTNVSVQQINSTTVKINWNSVSGAACYVITYGLAGTDTNTWSIFLAPQGNFEYVVSGLLPGRRYAFKLRTNCSFCTSRPAPGVKLSVFTQEVFFETSARLRQDEESVMQVYPNPNQGFFTVKYTAQEDAKGMIWVEDVAGKKVYTQAISAKSGDNQQSIDLTGMAAGVYLLRFNLNHTTQTIKVIIQ